MGKSTISMAIFNCYVSSPEGTQYPQLLKAHHVLQAKVFPRPFFSHLTVFYLISSWILGPQAKTHFKCQLQNFKLGANSIFSWSCSSICQLQIRSAAPFFFPRLQVELTVPLPSLAPQLRALLGFYFLLGRGHGIETPRLMVSKHNILHESGH